MHLKLCRDFLVLLGSVRSQARCLVAAGGGGAPVAMFRREKGRDKSTLRGAGRLPAGV